MSDSLFAELATSPDPTPPASARLENGSRVAVIGGGPAGALFSYFLLDMAERIGLELALDIYEPRDFSRTAPQGCNMCGGVISESLVQYLATEGINLPPTVVQRGIDSYMMHMDVGSVRIQTPVDEKRIGAVHRGAGPRDLKEAKWASFDGHLLGLAVSKGARVIQARVADVDYQEGRPRLTPRQGPPERYDLVAVATGLNSAALNMWTKLNIGYQPPKKTKTAIREYYLGTDRVEAHLGSAMHVFLLDIPRLEFAAIIPKGDYVTVCLLGDEVDSDLLQTFLTAPEVGRCFPPDWQWDQPACQCAPFIYTEGAVQPFGERVVFIGDCGVSRLYKDGIGAAYRAAKAAATTVIFQGISQQAFRDHYRPACRRIENDNLLGKVVFFVVGQIQRWRFARRALLRMVTSEQANGRSAKRMSTVLWDTFTGSAPYGEVFGRTLHPAFLASMFWSLAVSIFSRG